VPGNRHPYRDNSALRGRDWIEQQWEAARIEASEAGKGGSVANAATAGQCEVFYWRERNVEVDFVTRYGQISGSCNSASAPSLIAASDISRKHIRIASYAMLCSVSTNLLQLSASLLE
jgi:hypothetical protein